MNEIDIVFFKKNMDKCLKELPFRLIKSGEVIAIITRPPTLMKRVREYSVCVHGAMEGLCREQGCENHRGGGKPKESKKWKR